MMTLNTTLPRMALSICALGLLLPAPAAQVTKHAHRPAIKRVAAHKPAPKVNAALAPMVGAWRLRNGDAERMDIKMAFRADGTFVFAGPNWKSEGTYDFADHTVKLQWTTVDGQPIAPGAMHKDITLGENDASFKIDKYVYWKHVG